VEPRVRIELAGVERVGDFEPLWTSLHEHHLTVDPNVPGIPPRTADESWPIRRARYEEWLTHPGAFALLALDGEEPVGYAVVSFHDRDDTHTTGDRFAELHSLAVRADRRGAGIGTRLLRRVYAEVRAQGVEEMMIGVLATNDRVRRFYEREGFTPWVLLTLGKVPDPGA
jgi:GNAT superfamily N-acetyltransferase